MIDRLRQRSPLRPGHGLAAQSARAVQAATGTRGRAAQAVAESRASGPRRQQRRRCSWPISPQTAPADEQPVHRELLRSHRPASRHAD